MLRRILIGLLAPSVLVLGCGGAPPKPAEPPSLAVGGGDASVPADTTPADTNRRGASEAVKLAWPFAEPELAIYADVGGLLKTPMMSGLLKGIFALAATQITPPQRKCLDDSIANVKELAVGTDPSGGLAIARFDPSAGPALSACLTAFGDAQPTTMPGAALAWRVKKDAAAMTSTGLLFVGSEPLVTRALAGHGSGAGLASVTLGPSEYIAWVARIFDGEPPSRGTLLAADDRFRVAAESDLPSEEIAKEVETQLDKRVLASKVPSASGDTGVGAQALARLVGALAVKRNGKHLALAFELRETPQEQAQDLGTAAALGVFAVRKYLVNAKQAEAKNVLGQLSRSLIVSWELEDGTPLAKKKLVSFPAVPKLVPKGTKHQSTAADWKPWEPLHFVMSTPHYYQYEIKAAKDGESAEIIARGDLDGDGKTSQFKLLVKVKRPSNELHASPTIQEIDADE